MESESCGRIGLKKLLGRGVGMECTALSGLDAPDSDIGQLVFVMPHSLPMPITVAIQRIL